jgi:hypothetical protein
MADAFAIAEDMEVVGSDGQYVGRVDCLRDADVVLAAKDAEGGHRHHLIPVSWVDKVEAQDLRVWLDRPRDDAEREWREAD